MAMNFTPGPWNYGPDKQGRMRVYSGNYEVVRALSTHGFRKIPKPERMANAHLIAAAPEMYEALYSLLACVNEFAARVGWPDNAPRRAAEAALAKADGRTA